MSEKIQRRIRQTKARILDEAKGIMEYVASDQTIDSDREIVKVSGWRFDQFAKNSPFADSHNYSSIEFKLGEVIDWRIENDQLIETVQWLTGVPEHRLATIGWNLCLAGMAPACSVGFLPLSVVDRSKGSAWNQACQSVNQDPAKTSAVRIILVAQQKELSACIIGANPNATAKAKSAGIITDEDLETFWPDSERLIIKSRSYSFPSQSTTPANPAPTMSKAKLKLLEHLSKLPGVTPDADADPERQVYGLSADDIALIIGRVLNLLEQGRGAAVNDPVQLMLADPQKRFAINCAVRYHCNGKLPAGGMDLMKSWGTSQKGTFFGTSLAASIFPTDISKTILNTVLNYGAFKDFVQLATAQQTQYAKMTQVPDAGFITPNSGMGVTSYTPDVSLAGASLSDKMNTVAILLPVSEEWLQDTTIDIAPLFLTMFGQGLAKRIDYGCFQANGSDSQTDGLQTGIFVGAETAVNAAAGNTTLAQLQREDFLAAVGAVAAAALQRPCRWYINPAFIPTLLTLREANGTKFLLKTPAETQDGQWHLVGFPVTWAAQAPSAQNPGSSIAAFGQPEAFTVALREELEIMSSDKGPSFASNVRYVRALARSRSDLRESTYFALLNLAAQ